MLVVDRSASPSAATAQVLERSTWASPCPARPRAMLQPGFSTRAPRGLERADGAVGGCVTPKGLHLGEYSMFRSANKLFLSTVYEEKTLIT